MNPARSLFHFHISLKTKCEHEVFESYDGGQSFLYELVNYTFYVVLPTREKLHGFRRLKTLHSV